MLFIRIISIVFIVIGIFSLLLLTFLSRKNNNPPKTKKGRHHFCIIIPARYESKVIEGLLISIKNQSVKINMKDVYVVIESLEDKTAIICEKYGAEVVLRKNVKKQRKGYALDDAVKEILSRKKHYDAYFIFDADNVLDTNFIKNMIPIYDLGYDMACGYRNCKNGNKSGVAASSALTFFMINTIFNKAKNKRTKNITFSGTGFYIRGDIIEKLKGFPFHSLTEDYEISLYATLNNLTTYYNENSVFYDEQPVKFKDTINQRVRWIKGYFSVKFKYLKKLFKQVKKNDPNKGSKIDEAFIIFPFILIIFGLVIWIVSLFLIFIYKLLIQNILFSNTLYELILILIFIYLILFLLSLFLVIKEGNKINLSFQTKIKALLINPFFLISFIYCAILCIIKKEVTWKRVEHGN